MSDKNLSALDRIRAWRQAYQTASGTTPLEDISQLAAQLDLTHAHPSGIAQLFASGQAHLDSLFRDNGMLRAANRRLERVLDDRAVKERVSGCSELSLVVGVATWKGAAMPVLLYPVEVVPSATSPSKTAIRFTGKVELNSVFVSAMRARGITLNAAELFDVSHYEGGTPETSALFNAITAKTFQVIDDFTIERTIVLGCFVEPSSLLIGESLTIIDQLADGPTGNTLLDAIAGNEDARQSLKATIPEYSPFDGDPHNEYEIGDVDNTVRYAAQLAAAGHSLFLDEPANRDTAVQSAAIASRCIMEGRNVLYVPCVMESKRRFMQEIRTNEMSPLVLDVTDAASNKAIDRQLIGAVGFQPGTATSHFEQLADELVGVRSRLTRYLGDLHGANERWGFSAYETIQNLASIATLSTHPATRVRLSATTAHAIKDSLDEWGGKLEQAARLGEFTITPSDTAWFGASLFSEDEAVDAYQRVVRLLEKILPATREHVAATAQTCGFPIPTTAQEWGKQVLVLKNLRRVLDVFQPGIFERDIPAMIEATRSKADRKASGTSMGFWERRRHIKEAKSLLRVGAQIEDLHEALIVVLKQAQQWRTFVPAGGWPVLPPKLDQIIESQDALNRDLTALDTVLATTPAGGNLGTTPLNDVEARLKALFDDHTALDTLPARACLERDFNAAGLQDLVADLKNRQVAEPAVANELRLAWWTTVFDDIVHSSAIISNQDGSALSNAADRFSQVDTEHVRSIGAMVGQESMRRLSEMLFAHTQEANQLHTMLASSARVPLDRLMHTYPTIMKLAKPILVATPATLAAMTDPEELADVAIIDAAAHIAPIELLSVLRRARQVVVLAHGSTITSDSVKLLASLLPRVEIAGRPGRRAPRVAAFLKEHGYGDVSFDIATEAARGNVSYTGVDGVGVPVLTSGLVESNQQEIDAVVEMLRRRAAGFTIVPASYLLTIVTLSGTHRTRLGAELKNCAAKDAAFGKFLHHVRIIGLDEVAGAQSTDVIISLGFAKTSHGRLLQQFGDLEGEGGAGMLLDAMALAGRNLDIVSAFTSADLEEDRLHQPGPKLLREMVIWAEQLSPEPFRPSEHDPSVRNVLFADLAERVRARGLNVAVDYGFDDDPSARIPLVVGVPGKPFALAVLTDDANFMGVQSTRKRNRLRMEDLQMLGWSVMTVWSVGTFVNPDKEVDRIVAHLASVYGDLR
ncbi:helicase [Bifidobacterium avesanii]|uniref:Helicase n=1 Tax=Bifidobacterium avesanii TaxID=1798157 RepID=A0A7K3TGD2_9BIFI|nr:helicase [Bifidobacterium avesanii]KAB8294641.1 helicase [Bifidobacterium avesanii]NEG78148.1 helicase [Bifidobacterium avesanii]